MRDPKFVIETPERSTPSTILAEQMAKMAVRPVTNAACQAFEAALKRLLEAEPTSYLGCDYAPEPILAQAAMEAGIPAGNFPFKTMMYFLEDGTVAVSYGYGEPRVTLTLVTLNEREVINPHDAIFVSYDDPEAARHCHHARRNDIHRRVRH